MERDAARMAAAGWRLRGWRIRGQAGELQSAPEALGMGGYAWLGPYGCGYAVFELLRAAVWLLAWLFAAPYMLIRGRKRIDAAYEPVDLP